MVSKFINRLRGDFKYLVERHPFSIWLVEYIIKFPLFLPHDDEYLGLAPLAKKKKGLFLDIGANDGRSILSFHKLKKEWNIFSLEANVLHRKRLEKLKRKIPKLRFLIKAVGNVSGEKMDLYVPIYSFYTMHTAASADLAILKDHLQEHFGSRIARNFTYRKVTCTTIKIDDLKLPVDLIKIDIECKELDALLGCEKTIDKYSPPILLEYNKNNFRDVLKFFKKKKYVYYAFDAKKMKFVKFVKDKFRNFYCIPQDYVADLESRGVLLK